MQVYVTEFYSIIKGVKCYAVAFFATLVLHVIPAQAVEESATILSPSVSLSSDYISRGLSLNWGEPSLQGGIELMHRSGLYASFWATQISSKFYPNGNAEADIYAGYRGSTSGNLAYDIGLGSYFYPGVNYRDISPQGTYPDKRYDTVEAIIGVTRDEFNLKFSYCLTDYYGYDGNTVPLSLWNSGVTGGVMPGQGTRGSSYLELNINEDLGNTYALALHAGHQNVKNSSHLSYNDYRLGLSKAFTQGWSVAFAITATDGASLYDNFLAVDGSSGTKNIGGTRAVLSINRAF